MTERERRIQSCIDHIQSSVDIDPWAAELAVKALELMKEREPRARLVTREDFSRAPAWDGVLPCWKESKSPTRRSGWAVIVWGKALQDLENGISRYWTDKPTEEQMREEAWPGA